MRLFSQLPWSLIFILLEDLNIWSCFCYKLVNVILNNAIFWLLMWFFSGFQCFTLWNRTEVWFTLWCFQPRWIWSTKEPKGIQFKRSWQYALLELHFVSFIPCLFLAFCFDAHHIYVKKSSTRRTLLAFSFTKLKDASHNKRNFWPNRKFPLPLK